MQKIKILENEIAYSTMTEKCMLIEFRNRVEFLINEIENIRESVIVFNVSVLVTFLFKFYERQLITMEQLNMLIDSISQILENGGTI